MKKSSKKKALSLLMILFIIVGLLPTDMNVFVAKAGTTIYNFDPTVELATVGQGVNIPDGTVYQNYFTTFGSVDAGITYTTKRANSSTFSLEVAKSGFSGLAFTTTGTATVTLRACSTGSSNTSAVGIIDANGNLMTEASGITTVTGVASTQLSYSNLPAGTYKIISPVSSYGRGCRILYATVSEITAGSKATISNVTSTLSGNTATINWMAAGGSGEETTLIEYSNDGGSTWANVGTVAQNITSITQDLTNLPSGNYSYRVTGNLSPIQTDSALSWTQPRVSWATVSDPSATATQSGANINVNWSMPIGADGADTLIIDLVNSDNSIVSSKTITNSGATITTGAYTFNNIAASGNYTINLTATRADESTSKVVNGAANILVALALTDPSVISATGDGNGNVAFVWTSVKEATSYSIAYKLVGADDSTYIEAASGITGTSYTISALTAGNSYTIKITAVRNWPADTKSITYDKTVSGNVERVWNTGYIGTQASSNKANGKVTVNSDGSVFMYASDGKFASSNDGFIFYYTEVNASVENFTLTSTIQLTTIKDNQSGVGLMVADTLGQPDKADLASGINFYMAGISKVVFTPQDATTPTTYSCGTSFRKVTGCTDPTGVDTSTRVLDQSQAFQTNLDPTQVINTANLAAGTCQNTFTFSLTKDNNGYYATMQGSDQVIHAYDPSQLLRQNGDKVYVGFAIARGTTATFSNTTFESRNPANDPPRDEATWEKSYTPQNLFVFTGATTGTSNYTYRYYGNWGGQLVLTNGSGDTLLSQNVEAGETITFPMQLTKGTTTLITTITPDPNKVTLQSYDPVVIERSVTYNTVGNEGETIIVSPDAPSGGKGTEASPMDIYSAVKYAQPGQVIYLKNGTYNLTGPVSIPYSVSGTADKMITLLAEDPGQVILNGSQIPEASSAILNVNGDYWRVYGLEISNASKNTKGVGVGGNHNIIEMCNIHDNGTTGLQISRASGEPKVWWPSNNLIKNCTSYNNCDPLMNDADGFAAKLTVGEGNRFYGCISYHNIDDGWDLYAKNEIGQGSIGAVTIENSVAYANGFIPGIGYGEGNGFKLGGEGLPGAHRLINSISFNNGGKGITSNNGPDCQVINCTSFNNNFYYATGAVSKTSSSPNIGLTPLNGSKYSGVTNYILQNTLSIYNIAKGTADQLTVIGQNPLQSENNYLVNSSLKSVNSLGVEATADWFQSVDTLIVPTREMNGTINMHSLLSLKPEYAILGVGATIATTGDAISVAPVKTTVVTPKTGDVTNIIGYIILAAISGVAIILLIYFSIRKRRNVRR